MKEIPLYKCVGNGRSGKYELTGKYAIIDDDDAILIDCLTSHWLLHSQGYAYTNVGGSPMLMHRYIIGIDDSTIHTDHFNHDRLDNRKQNIKACSQAENNSNLPYKGYGPFRGKWRAWAKTTGKYLGVYNTEEEAKEAVNGQGVVSC